MPENKKTVLIVGGGVAALAAAAALVEHNREKRAATGVEFDITIMTSDDVWGGRACSWCGGEVRKRFEKVFPGDRHPPKWTLQSWDFCYWPPSVPLNHGFHAVFDESTYRNFWYTLALAGRPHEMLIQKEVLISNGYEMLVHEAETETVCRLQINDPNKYPPPFNTHLTDAAFEVWRRGGWSLAEIGSFGLKVMNKVLSYSNFDELANLDIHQRISFQKWCRDQGVRESIFNKMMFKFLFQGTYIAPNTMDATSALMGLWIILRDKDAAQWFYINGGITALLMDPIACHLEDNGVRFLKSEELLKFVPSRNFSMIQSVTSKISEAAEPDAKEMSKQFDYYISTLPLDSLSYVLDSSVPTGVNQPGDPTLLDVFPDIQTLRRDKRFPETAGTVNLQAWFKDKGLLADARTPDGDYKNVIAGLEPLCVIIDYKNVLPMYKNSAQFSGSVLEINGSLQELQSPENYGYFECDNRFGKPNESRTIEFAKSIMMDLAERYKFPELKKAVKANAFLELPDDPGAWPNRNHWNGTRKVPPFLWKNTDPYNRFFVTGPGTLQYRPWIWRERYSDWLLLMRRHKNGMPVGYPKNLFIAGDWTRNGFDVPCMEGAARSGRMAAQCIVKTELKIDATADPREPDPHRDDDRLIKVLDPS